MTSKKLFLLLTLALCAGSFVQAQTTIINTPSTDVVAPGQTYIEFDYSSHLARFRNGGTRTYGFRAVQGVTKGVEVGANVLYSESATPDQPVEVQPNAKWQFYQNEKHGIAATAGVWGFIPVHNRQGTDTFAMTYTNVSKRFKGSYGPRVTIGGYAQLGRSRGTGPLRGATAAYEQPVHKKVTLVTDWFSGNNRFGYVAPGLIYTINSKHLLGAAYYMGNSGRGNNGLFVYYGITF